LRLATRKYMMHVHLKDTAAALGAAVVSAAPILPLVYYSRLPALANVFIGAFIYLAAYLTLTPVFKAVKRTDLEILAPIVSRIRILRPAADLIFAYETRLLNILERNTFSWEAFRADYSKLLQKYELLLGQLEVARTKMAGSEEGTDQQMAKSGETLGGVKKVLDRLCSAIRSELRLELSPKTDWSVGETVPPVIRCRYCGSEIASSARFCDHCGKVNTRTICKCGNELNESDVFCDRCGLRVTVT
jgi:hypothetical protein